MEKINDYIISKLKDCIADSEKVREELNKKDGTTVDGLKILNSSISNNKTIVASCNSILASIRLNDDINSKLKGNKNEMDQRTKTMASK